MTTYIHMSHDIYSRTIIDYALNRIWNIALKQNPIAVETVYADLITTAWEMPRDYDFIVNTYIFRNEKENLIDVIIKWGNKRNQENL